MRFKDKYREELFRAKTAERWRDLPALEAVEALPDQSPELRAYVAEWAKEVRGMPRVFVSQTQRARHARQAELWKAMSRADQARVDAAYKAAMGLSNA